MKRIVICMDGTWQKLDQQRVTNVGVIALSVAHLTAGKDGAPVEQIVIYRPGVGSVTSALPPRDAASKLARWLRQLWAGAFGSGVEDIIVEAYLQLCFNYEDGDEIYIFGYSRGAFAARSLAGMISNVGILSRRYVSRAWDAFRLYRARVERVVYALEGEGEQLRLTKKRTTRKWSEADEAEHQDVLRQFRLRLGKGGRNAQGARVAVEQAPPIAYMGIFDTVVQRGLDNITGRNRKFQFHDLNICANVERARHALALDEKRWAYPPRLWENLDRSNRGREGLAYEQRWFAGTHGDLGGGVESGLGALALDWIVEGARLAGLEFYPTEESPLMRRLKLAGIPYPKQPREAAGAPLPYAARVARTPLLEAWLPFNWPLRERSRWLWPRADAAPSREDALALFHESVALRCCVKAVKPRYGPSHLKTFEPHLREWAKQYVAEPDMWPPKRRLFAPRQAQAGSGATAAKPA